MTRRVPPFGRDGPERHAPRRHRGLDPVEIDDATGQPETDRAQGHRPRRRTPLQRVDAGAGAAQAVQRVAQGLGRAFVGHGANTSASPVAQGRSRCERDAP